MLRLIIQVLTEEGSSESRTLLLPLAAIEDFADFDPTVYDPSVYSNGWELLEQNGEGVSLEIPNPLAQQSTFCVVETGTLEQRCAELADYNVVSIDIENIRNNIQRHFPDSYYVCPDQSCAANPGVQNVVFGGDGFIAYFKDSNTNIYYSATADMRTFMDQGDDALSFTEVKNGAGESEIISTANKTRAEAQRIFDSNESVIAAYDMEAGAVLVKFGRPMSRYQAVPGFTLRNTSTDVVVSGSTARWLDDHSTLAIDVSSSDAKEDTYQLEFNDWLFTAGSSLRWALSEPLRFGLTRYHLGRVNAVVLDGDAQIGVTDYDPVTDQAVSFTIGFDRVGGALTADVTSTPFNEDNMANALDGRDFQTRRFPYRFMVCQREMGRQNLTSRFWMVTTTSQVRGSDTLSSRSTWSGAVTGRSFSWRCRRKP
jgi:hypothetical protein